MIRAVIDTNVLISGLIKREGPPGRLLEALFQRDVMMVAAPPLLAELSKALTYPRLQTRYGITPERSEALLTALVLLSDVIELPRFVWRASRDPQDDMFLACAIHGDAEYVITGDRDLLVLESFRGVRIVTPERFLTALKGSR